MITLISDYALHILAILSSLFCCGLAFGYVLLERRIATLQTKVDELRAIMQDHINR